MAFVGLVGLYACSVRRLRSGKRKPANLLNCFAPMFSALAVASCVVVALLLFFVCFDWVVGCGSFSLRTDATKRKGAPLLVLPLFVRGFVMRLLIVRGLPAIPFQLLRGLVRNCSNTFAHSHNISTRRRFRRRFVLVGFLPSLSFPFGRLVHIINYH